MHSLRLESRIYCPISDKRGSKARLTRPLRGARGSHSEAFELKLACKKFELMLTLLVTLTCFMLQASHLDVMPQSLLLDLVVALCFESHRSHLEAGGAVSGSDLLDVL